MAMSGQWALGVGRGTGEQRAYDHRIARRLIEYLRPHAKALSLAIVLVLVSSAAGLMGPLLLRFGIDDGIRQGDAQVLMVVGVIYLASLAVMWVTGYWQVRIIATVGQRSLLRLRGNLFAKLQRLSLAYYSRHPLGAVTSRITNDMDVLSEFVTLGIVSLVGGTFSLLVIIVMMFTFDLRLSAVTLAVLPLMWLASALFSRLARRAFREVRTTVGDVYANLQESIDGVKTAQSFVRERANTRQFEQTNQRNVNASIRAGAVMAGFIPVVDTISAVATALVIGVGGAFVVGGSMDPGVMIGFLALTTRFFQPIQELTRLYNQVQSTMAAGEKIFEVIDEPEDVTDRAGASDMPLIKGRVEFDGVSFHYEQEDVLSDVSFSIEPGLRVALVGPTGAGKTTTINLLARFYDVQEGEIRIDGRPITTVTQHSLRSQMGIVPQDSFLFSGSVHDNIAFARPGAARSDVIEAARAVGAHDFISQLPDGYDTEVRERGARLSAGQRQLVSFARALLADPRILMLDEATSSVDAHTELVIQAGLERLMKGRTTFVIAHRLATVRDADLILVFQDGEIVERGAHAELLAAEGLYHKLYTTGFPGKETAEPPAPVAAPHRRGWF